MNCPVQLTLDLVGEKWTLLILRDASNGARRFDDFRRHIGLSEAVLSDRLRKLTAAGILKAVPYQEPGSRARHEYRLAPVRVVVCTAERVVLTSSDVTVRPGPAARPQP